MPRVNYNEVYSYYCKDFSIVCHAVTNEKLVFCYIKNGDVREEHDVHVNDVTTALSRLKDKYIGLTHLPIPTYEETRSKIRNGAF